MKYILLLLLSISYDRGVDVQGISIYNSLGSKILELPNYTDMIDISSLVSGTYILELTTNSGKYTRTFIKM